MPPPPGPSGKRREAATDPPAAPPYSKTAAKELRRTRGEIACAECRRFVSAAKDHLQKKLGKLQERMRALEDALAIAQTSEDDEPHPLLRQPFRFGDEGESPVEDDEDEQGEGEDQSPPVEALADSFGTLHIDQREKTLRFYGPTGGVESLLDDGDSSDRPFDPDENNIDLRALGLPVELDPFYYAFPHSPTGLPTAPVRTIIESYVPPWNRAVQLCRILLEHLSWMFQVVTFQQFTQDLMPTVYTADGADATPGPATCGPHDLALFFGVLAIGALVDLSLPPYNSQAQLYYVLCRCALALDSPMASASLATVKTMHFVSLYNGMSGKESNMSNTYTVLNFGGGLACKIGLHIDPDHWKMSPREAYARRTYFWNLLQGDIWQSLGTGRPSGLVNAYGYCRIPTEQEEQEYQRGEYSALGFGVWGFNASEQLLIPTMKLVMSVKPPSYRAVLDLDQKIRSYRLYDTVDNMDSPSVATSMGCWVRSHYMEVILLALHRAFFAQAMATNPQNPFDSPYGKSFITAYQCAWRVIETTSYAFKRHHQLMSRVWMIWSFNFSSAVIIGAVASRCKDLPIDPPPLAALHQACLLFESGSRTNSRAAKALPVLLKMHERAVRLHGAAAKTECPPGGEELAVLAGRPRLTVAPCAQPAPPPAPSAVYAPRPPVRGGWDYGVHPVDPHNDPRYAQPGMASHRPTHPHAHATDSRYEPYAAAVPPEMWDAAQGAQPGAQYSYEAVDFNLGDAWSTFMRSVGM
ncbi:fungal specific transcription factor domain-containing protein [Phanerochaete sordida]|uniref:Fungal specific transcription factor domain-containing protein n=1 Tax=Phanerochaete sordida TaxID=48140 RepID=A0A9P3FZU2_9APHY|nr:fungal specific transcription factor domain-containing protein [Phanerochaete sordida]